MNEIDFVSPLEIEFVFDIHVWLGNFHRIFFFVSLFVVVHVEECRQMQMNFILCGTNRSEGKKQWNFVKIKNLCTLWVHNKKIYSNIVCV